jgi:molecular chaperone GrpE (heat shock protein)
MVAANTAKAEKTTALGKRLKKLVADMEKTKVRIAKERDALRDQLDEAQAIMNDMDDSVDELVAALRTIDDVADNLSKYL